jgi:hypothetical protein
MITAECSPCTGHTGMAAPTPKIRLRCRPRVLFFCDFGCATLSLLDRRHRQGQMWWSNMGERDKLALTLPQWLAAWLAGRIDAVRHSRTLMLAEEAWSRADD